MTFANDAMRRVSASAARLATPIISNARAAAVPSLKRWRFSHRMVYLLSNANKLQAYT